MLAIVTGYGFARQRALLRSSVVRASKVAMTVLLLKLASDMIMINLHTTIILVRTGCEPGPAWLNTRLPNPAKK
jgi:hypothetical protein